MTKRINRKPLIDFPPEAQKEDLVKRQVKWPQSLYDRISYIASKKELPFMHIVINAMRVWVSKQEENDKL